MPCPPSSYEALRVKLKQGGRGKKKKKNGKEVDILSCRSRTTMEEGSTQQTITPVYKQWLFIGIGKYPARTRGNLR